MRRTPGGLPCGDRFPTAALALLALLALACDGGSGEANEDAGSERGVATSPDSPPAFDVETIATGLGVPWDLAFAPDGRIFVSERPGRIRVIESGRLQAEPWAELPVAASGEAGLMAIALDPDFASNGRVYVVGTFRGRGGELENRVIRLTERDGRGTAPEPIIAGLPAARFHAGAALDFGPDGMLYVTTGDAAGAGAPRDPRSLAGKLLRYRADGSVPADNPFPGPVYALGLRNTQGLGWDAGSGELFGSEHGPSGIPYERMRRGNDELNHLIAGGDYGWPDVAGRQNGGPFIDPLAVWTSAIAPSGLAIYSGDEFPAWRGDAFVGALRGEQLRRVDLERAGGGWRAVAEEALFEGRFGRIRAVEMGPDGRLYFTTSNRDGRGDPEPEDDRVLRIVPRR